MLCLAASALLSHIVQTNVQLIWADLKVNRKDCSDNTDLNGFSKKDMALKKMSFKFLLIFFHLDEDLTEYTNSY